MSFIQRLQDALGWNDPYDELLDGEGVEDPAYEAAQTRGRSVPNNVIEIPGLSSMQVEIVLMRIRSFDECPQAVTAMRERKAIVLDVGLLAPDMAQRCVDYVAGGAFAIDGNQERLGDTVFLFTPSFMSIHSQIAAEPAAADRSSVAAWGQLGGALGGQAEPPR